MGSYSSKSCQLRGHLGIPSNKGPHIFTAEDVPICQRCNKKLPYTCYSCKLKTEKHSRERTFYSGDGLYIVGPPYCRKCFDNKYT